MILKFKTPTKNPLIIEEWAFAGRLILPDGDLSIPAAEIRRESFANVNWGEGHHISFTEQVLLVGERSFADSIYESGITFEIQGSEANGTRPEFSENVFENLSPSGDYSFPDLVIDFTTVYGYSPSSYNNYTPVVTGVFDTGTCEWNGSFEYTTDNGEDPPVTSSWTGSLQYVRYDYDLKRYVGFFDDGGPDSIFFFLASNILEDPDEEPTIWGGYSNLQQFIDGESGNPNGGDISVYYDNSGSWPEFDENIQFIVPSGELPYYHCGEFREKSKYFGKIQANIG